MLCSYLGVDTGFGFVYAQIGHKKCTASSQSAMLRFPSASMSLKGLGVGKVINPDYHFPPNEFHSTLYAGPVNGKILD